MKSFFVASSLALTIYFSLTPLMGVYGILIGMLTSEIVLTMGMTFYIIKNHIWKPTNDLLDEQMQLTKGI
jgi:Na+-driven multidrug efflux pump